VVAPVVHQPACLPEQKPRTRASLRATVILPAAMATCGVRTNLSSRAKANGVPNRTSTGLSSYGVNSTDANSRLNRMHEVEALIAKSNHLAAGARRLECAIVCPLVQGFSLLPITEDLAKELAVNQSETKASPGEPIPDLSNGVRALAIDISHDTPVAYIATFYFGGQGGQEAAVWDKGNLQFSPTTQGHSQGWPNSSISQALRLIGVVTEQGMDEFDTVGLGKHRKTHQWAESAK
jgi:hypothetical protein